MIQRLAFVSLGTISRRLCRAAMLLLLTVSVTGCMTTRGIWKASSKGKVARVQRLLAAGVEVDAVYKDGSTPLFAASENGESAVVKLLLEAGAVVDAAHQDGRTTLWVASQNGHSEVVKLLLEAGADQSVTAQGETPRSIAQKNGHQNIVRILDEWTSEACF